MKIIPQITSLIVVIILININQIDAQRITIEGNKFMVGDREIFINGVNTPWDNWNDFGGNYDHLFWDEEFQQIREAGGNASRIWITCNGDVGIDIDELGSVNGATQAHWEDLDDMFALAEKHGIYIMATLTSFDHTKNTYTKYQRWRKMLADDEKTGSYIDNYVIPFINRYKDNPYLWCIDVCNEIEWMHENSECGNIPWNRLQYFVARVATAVHENSNVPVTLGSAAVKWNSDCNGCEGNFWNDANLQSAYSSSEAFLDFYSPHYYGWVVRWFGNFAVDKTPDDYGINDRPCMVGENPANGVYTQDESWNNVLVVPISEAYIKTYQQGWKGLMVWTSNGVDGNGSLAHCGPGLTAFYNQYPELVFPGSSGSEIRINPNKEVQLWPNPAKNHISINRPEGDEVLVELYDIYGRQKLSELLYTFENSGIEISTLQPGIYFASITFGKKNSRLILLKE
ncbi:MAG: T9SS type A sorting domain-containing protein [Bacteroidales bacterium]|nr:T9SS type A sorting domain-containing protein [Bacteroidales bacterium]